MSLVQTTDFFFPLVDDPYVMGKIACANVLSDLYAMGVADCDNVLMLLGVPTGMTSHERTTVTPMVMKGFNDLCHEAGTVVRGGQTTLNPWFLIGGVASAVCAPDEWIIPNGAVEGDVLVLTKPLGTQPAVNAHEWLAMESKAERTAQLASAGVTPEDIESAYALAEQSMSSLNRTAARLMHTHGAHGATDVTGFGLLGHARNLALCQKEAVSFRIHTFPVIHHMCLVDKTVSFSLREGFSAETSGGLLVLLPSRSAADAFIGDLKTLHDRTAWIVGDVIAGDRSAALADDLKFIEVTSL